MGQVDRVHTRSKGMRLHRSPDGGRACRSQLQEPNVQERRAASVQNVQNCNDSAFEENIHLGQQIGAQDVTQHRQLKRLVQNLFGPCIKRTVDTLFNIAGSGPPGIYDHWNISRGLIRL